MGLIQEGLRRGLDGTEAEGNLRIKGLFRVLAEERFDSHATAELFLEF